MVADPKNFLKALLALIYTNIDGVARAEKTHFFKIFQKVPKNDFFNLLFIQNYACGVEILVLAKTGTFSCFGRA